MVVAGRGGRVHNVGLHLVNGHLSWDRNLGKDARDLDACVCVNICGEGAWSAGPLSLSLGLLLSTFDS